MKGGALILLLILLILEINTSQAIKPTKKLELNDELKLVQVITRHGDRVATRAIKAAPAYWYCSTNTLASPSDGLSDFTPIKYQNYRAVYMNGRQSLLGNCTAGQLTSIGQNQTHQLGAQFSAEYIDKFGLLPQNYSSSTLFIRSSESSRCQQSARSIMGGMYPELEREDAISIPIWLVEKDEDNMRMNMKKCPAILLKFAEYLLKHPADIISIVTPILPYLRQLSNIYNTSHPIAAALYNFDNCNCRTFHDIPLPNGMSDRIFKAVEKSYWIGGGLLFESSSSLSMGSFIGELIDYMDQKIEGTLEESFQLFSAHDTTVAPILSYFEIYDGDWPPYASHLHFHLFSQSSKYYVSVYYNDKLMTIPKCGTTQCEYSLFRSIALANIPSDPKAACKLSTYLNITLPGRDSPFDSNLRELEEVIGDHYAHLDYPLFDDDVIDRSTVLDLAFAFIRSMSEFM